jgi:hypothetical protein
MNNDVNSAVSGCIFSTVQRTIVMMRVKYFIHNRSCIYIYMDTFVCHMFMIEVISFE